MADWPLETNETLLWEGAPLFGQNWRDWTGRGVTTFVGGTIVAVIFILCGLFATTDAGRMALAYSCAGITAVVILAHWLLRQDAAARTRYALTNRRAMIRDPGLIRSRLHSIMFADCRLLQVEQGPAEFETLILTKTHGDIPLGVAPTGRDHLMGYRFRVMPVAFVAIENATALRDVIRGLQVDAS